MTFPIVQKKNRLKQLDHYKDKCKTSKEFIGSQLTKNQQFEMSSITLNSQLKLESQQSKNSYTLQFQNKSKKIKYGNLIPKYQNEMRKKKKLLERSQSVENKEDQILGIGSGKVEDEFKYPKGHLKTQQQLRSKMIFNFNQTHKNVDHPSLQSVEKLQLNNLLEISQRKFITKNPYQQQNQERILELNKSNSLINCSMSTVNKNLPEQLDSLDHQPEISKLDVHSKDNSSALFLDMQSQKNCSHIIKDALYTQSQKQIKYMEKENQISNERLVSQNLSYFDRILEDYENQQKRIEQLNERKFDFLQKQNKLLNLNFQSSPILRYGFRNYSKFQFYNIQIQQIENESSFASISQKQFLKLSKSLFKNKKYIDHSNFKEIMRLRFKNIQNKNKDTILSVIERKKQSHQFEERLEAQQNYQTEQNPLKIKFLSDTMNSVLERRNRSDIDVARQKFNGIDQYRIQFNLKALYNKVKTQISEVRLQPKFSQKVAINQMKIWNIKKTEPLSPLKIGVRKFQLQHQKIIGKRNLLKQNNKEHNNNSEIYAKLIESYREMIKQSQKLQIEQKLLLKNKEIIQTCTGVYLVILKRNFSMFNKNQIITNRILLFFNIDPVNDFFEITFEQYCDFVGTLIFRDLGLNEYKIYFIQQVLLLEQQYTQKLENIITPKEEFLKILQILLENDQERNHLYIKLFEKHHVLNNENNEVDIQQFHQLFLQNILDLNSFLDLFL